MTEEATLSPWKQGHSGLSPENFIPSPSGQKYLHIFLASLHSYGMRQMVTGILSSTERCIPTECDQLHSVGMQRSVETKATPNTPHSVGMRPTRPSLCRYYCSGRGDERVDGLGGFTKILKQELTSESACGTMGDVPLLRLLFHWSQTNGDLI